MNYFELHIGDYEAATAHLTMLEDAAYSRMLRIYYRTEKPLPADVKQVCRLVRAASKPERDAVQQVLQDFFTLTDDGWHQARTDSEIAQYQAGEPEREAKKANEESRLRRHREERAALFKQLTDAGQHAAWNTGTKELRKLVELLQLPKTATPATEPDTPPATAPATLATATHTPDTTSHTPDTRDKRERRAQAPHDAAASPPSRGSRLPKDWTPEPVHMAFAEGLGLANGKAAAELEKFRDYWAAQPGQKGVKTDWPATWRNWVRRAVEATGKPGALPAASVFDGAH